MREEQQDRNKQTTKEQGNPVRAENTTFSLHTQMSDMERTNPAVTVNVDTDSAATVQAPPKPNNAILDPIRKLFRLRKSSGGTIAKGAFGIHLAATTSPTNTANDAEQENVVDDAAERSSSPNDDNDDEGGGGGEEEEDDDDDDDEEESNNPLHTNDQEQEGENVDKETAPESKTKPTVISEWYLFIEEAIYLHERGLLDVHDATDKKMESYDLYQLLPVHGMPWPVYLVYAHLRQQTFKVVRYSHERREIIQEQIKYLRQEKEEKQRLEKEQQLQLQQKEEETQPQEGSANNGQEQPNEPPPPQPLVVEKKRRPNFGLRLRQAATHARPPPWDNVSRHLAWDVYRPDSRFQKREPGLPSFSVLVTSHASPFSVQRLRTLVQANDPVNIKVATVADTGTVIVFGLTNIGAPTMATGKAAAASATTTDSNPSKEPEGKGVVED